MYARRNRARNAALSLTTTDARTGDLTASPAVVTPMPRRTVYLSGGRSLTGVCSDPGVSSPSGRGCAVRSVVAMMAKPRGVACERLYSRSVLATGRVKLGPGDPCECAARV